MIRMMLFHTGITGIRRYDRCAVRVFAVTPQEPDSCSNRLDGVYRKGRNVVGKPATTDTTASNANERRSRAAHRLAALTYLDGTKHALPQTFLRGPSSATPKACSRPVGSRGHAVGGADPTASRTACGLQCAHGRHPRAIARIAVQECAWPPFRVRIACPAVMALRRRTRMRRRQTCRRPAGIARNATHPRAARQSSGFYREVFVTFR